MKILLSNDDGYFAKGLNILTEALELVADVIVMAPDQNRSGASNSLTLNQPLRVSKLSDNRFKVNGTPADCVHLALTGYLNTAPDLVISGINHGANLGDDVIYSGTVAAAMEGRFLDLPSIAVSLVGKNPKHFKTAADVVVKLVKKIKRSSFPPDVVLNLNVPNIPTSELKGVKTTRLGTRIKSEKILKEKDPYEKDLYWIGPAGEANDDIEGTDFEAISQGFASITPLRIDMTRASTMQDLSNWLRLS